MLADDIYMNQWRLKCGHIPYIRVVSLLTVIASFDESQQKKKKKKGKKVCMKEYTKYFSIDKIATQAHKKCSQKGS